MSLNKKSQLESVDKIREEIKSGNWSIDSLKIEKGSVEKDNYKTGFVEHHPSGDVTITLHVTDKEVQKKAQQFLSTKGLI